MTTITRLKGTVNADLPVLTKSYGIVENTQEGLFLAALERTGMTLDQTGRGAVGEFYAEGARRGWLSKILYALPFICDADHPNAAGVPMIDRFHSHALMMTGTTGRGLTGGVPPQALVTDGSGRVTGVRPWRTDSCLVSRLTIYDLFAKYPGCANVRNGNYGMVWYGQTGAVAAGSTARIAGAGTPTAAENYLGISTEGHFFQKVMGRDVRSADVGKKITAGGLHLLCEDMGDRAYGKNIMRYRLRDAAMATMEALDETAARASVDTVHDSTATARWSVNGHWNNTTVVTTHSNVSAQVETRYIAWHDGTLDAEDEATFVPALKRLLAAFGKA